MLNIIIFILHKSGDIVLGILLTKLLSDENLKRSSYFLKHQMLVLYLDWVLQKTPFRKPPEEEDR